jgi:hypothetical protein
MRLKRVLVVLAVFLMLGGSGAAGWIGGIETSSEPDPGWGAD